MVAAAGLPLNLSHFTMRRWADAWSGCGAGGYSFYRAFRTWTGTTPDTIRATSTTPAAAAASRCANIHGTTGAVAGSGSIP
jgi:hypothetical protein